MNSDTDELADLCYENARLEFAIDACTYIDELEKKHHFLSPIQSLTIKRWLIDYEPSDKQRSTNIRGKK